MERKKKEKERIMPILVATTSALARTTCVRTHFFRTNNPEGPTCKNIFVARFCSWHYLDLCFPMLIPLSATKDYVGFLFRQHFSLTYIRVKHASSFGPPDHVQQTFFISFLFIDLFLFQASLASRGGSEEAEYQQ